MVTEALAVLDKQCGYPCIPLEDFFYSISNFLFYKFGLFLGLTETDITKILWDCRGGLSTVGIADLITKALAMYPPEDVASKFLNAVDRCGKYQEYLAVKYMQLGEMEKDPFDIQELKLKPITGFFEKFQKVTQVQFVIAETMTYTHSLVYPLIPYSLGYSRASLQRVVHDMRTH